MNSRILSLFLVLTTGILWSNTMNAETVSKPKFHVFQFADGSTLQNMSDNGLWAVAAGTYAEDESKSAYPKIINLTTDEVNALDIPDDVLGCGLSDITNNGSMAVGNYNNQPAVYLAATNRWISLPTPEDWRTSGNVNAVTPDGQLAVGTAMRGVYDQSPMLWDLSGDEPVIVEIPNLPTLDMTGENQNQNTLLSITSDGRYILGCLSFSYVKPAGICYYVYDRLQETHRFIGFDVDAQGNWTSRAEDMLFIETASLAPGGKHVAGTAYMVPQNENSSEYHLPYLYDISTGAFTLYTESMDHDMSNGCVDGSGHVFAATPPMSPAREWSIRQGKYWYSLTQILKQGYGINYNTATTFENTGTPLAVNDTGDKVLVFVYRGESYVLEMPQPFAELTADMDLLAEYSVTPAIGSTISQMSKLSITFDRNITVKGTKTAVTIKDESGTTKYTAVSFKQNAGDTKTVDITFRSATLENGKKYYVVIEAGSIAVAGDEERINKEIKIEYTGRTAKPVEWIKAAPANGSTQPLINNSTNPVILTFDTGIAKTDTAWAALYRGDETEPICELNLALSSSDPTNVALYPTAGQYLYKGSEYYLRIKKGSLTDVMGANPNEAIELHYSGGYEREISYDEEILFEEDFNDGINDMLCYEGDKLKPSETPELWGFTTTTTPWWVASDDHKPANLAAVSHSMYSPAGKSDDWMCTPQINIPSATCYLRFEAQSYLNGKTDKLKVIVWENDGVLNTLTETDVNSIRENGKTVLEETLLPGAKEDSLDGDWKEYTVSLKAYEGKNIYIAFVNENNDQSAVFVDNIKVVEDQKFLVGLLCEQTVVKQESIIVKGRISVKSEVETFNKVNVILKNASGETIDEVNKEGLSLNEGDSYEFIFSKPLPLTVGESNRLILDVTLGEQTRSLEYSIKNLAFSPEKRIVIEEYTGRDCPNCPLGILALENLESKFGDRIIPMAIHTYGNDPYASQQLYSYSSFLNFAAAPTGVINRQGGFTPVPSKPMAQAKTSDGKIIYVFSNGTDLWLDYVEEEFKTAADANLNITAKYENGNIVTTSTIEYALNATDLNVNLFLVLTEDSLTSYQQNNLGGTSDPNLGEFGLGGKYSSAVIMNFNYMDVARTLVGTSFTGTPGYVPTTVKAGQEYTANISFAMPENIANLKNCKVIAMMIDANTGNVINAARTTIDPNGYTAVEQSRQGNADIRICDGYVLVNTAGEEAQVTLYTTDGRIITHETINSAGRISTDGYKGILLVDVKTDRTRFVKKAVVK